jgi:hypothetical protein
MGEVGQGEVEFLVKNSYESDLTAVSVPIMLTPMYAAFIAYRQTQQI